MADFVSRGVTAFRGPLPGSIPMSLALGLAVLGTAAVAGVEDSSSVRVIHVEHVEQPTGVEMTDYVRTWPMLEPYVVRLRKGDRIAVAKELHGMAAGAAPSDGALNLLAQLKREDGALSDAEDLIERAIALNPKQHLHHFQHAMIYYTRLTRASAGLERWKWHRRTRDAYQRAFELDSRPIPYRYYLAYSYLQTPGFAGGDKDKGLRMAQGGIEIGQKEFYVVRADAYRLRGEVAQAFADYDRAMAEGIFKLNSFLAAGVLATDSKDLVRAKRYADYAVRCRPDSPRTHEALGDYYAVVGESRAAISAYEAALRADPGDARARDKLAKLRAKPKEPK